MSSVGEQHEEVIPEIVSVGEQHYVDPLYPTCVGGYGTQNFPSRDVGIDLIRELRKSYGIFVDDDEGNLRQVRESYGIFIDDDDGDDDWDYFTKIAISNQEGIEKALERGFVLQTPPDFSSSDDDDDGKASYGREAACLQTSTATTRHISTEDEKNTLSSDTFRKQHLSNSSSMVEKRKDKEADVLMRAETEQSEVSSKKKSIWSKFFFGANHRKQSSLKIVPDSVVETSTDVKTLHQQKQRSSKALKQKNPICIYWYSCCF